MRAKLLPILVAAGLLTALVMAVLPLRSANAQCGTRTNPCPPPEKKPTRTRVSPRSTPTPTPTSTPTPTRFPTRTSTPTAPPAGLPLTGGEAGSNADGNLPAVQNPPFFIWFNVLGGGLLLGLLIVGFIWFRNRLGKPGEERGALNAYLPPPDADMPGGIAPPEPEMPAGVNPPDPDMPAGTNPPDPDMPAGE
jgi:hypothetical protein